MMRADNLTAAEVRAALRGIRPDRTMVWSHFDPVRDVRWVSVSYWVNGSCVAQVGRYPGGPYTLTMS